MPQQPLAFDRFSNQGFRTQLIRVGLTLCRSAGMSPARMYPAQTGASAWQLTSRAWRVQGPLMFGALETTAPEPTRHAQQQEP